MLHRIFPIVLALTMSACGGGGGGSSGGGNGETSTPTNNTGGAPTVSDTPLTWGQTT